MPPRDGLIQHMIDELETLARGLTKWEEEFLHDVTDQWNKGRRLTENQYDKLKAIYEERVP